jgi:hypothetical protein
VLKSAGLHLLAVLLVFGFVLFSSILFPCILTAAPVAVRHKEGVAHGFLVLRTLQGKMLAVGDLVQVTRDDEVTIQFTLRFKDGSLHDETTIYSQRGVFRLLSDHLVQKGPSFPHPIEVWIDIPKGKVTTHYTDEGKEKAQTDQIEMPEDAANGLMLNLLKNIQPEDSQTTVSLVAATPKPRVVKLVISASGQQSFSIGGSPLKANHFVVKIDIGGVAGAVAPLVGKKPTDTQVWVYGGDAPTVVRFEGALYEGGPIWRIEPASLVWH